MFFSVLFFNHSDLLSILGGVSSCHTIMLQTIVYLTYLSLCPGLPRWPSGKASASRAKVPGSNPACAGIFSGLSHTCDLNIGTPVATLPGDWR